MAVKQLFDFAMNEVIVPVIFALSVKLVPGWKKYQKSTFACIMAGAVGIALSI